jgi:hypothetical protein
MSDEGPPPIVPKMRTTDDSPEQDTDPVRTDGGETTLPDAPEDRPYGAPLVPDCS